MSVRRISPWGKSEKNIWIVNATKYEINARLFLTIALRFLFVPTSILISDLVDYRMTSKTCQTGIVQVEPWYFPWWRHSNSCCSLRHVPFLICEQEKKLLVTLTFIPTHIFFNEDVCRSISVCYSSNFDLPNRQKTHVADTLDGRHLLKMSSLLVGSALQPFFLDDTEPFPNPSRTLPHPQKRENVAWHPKRRKWKTHSMVTYVWPVSCAIIKADGNPSSSFKVQLRIR